MAEADRLDELRDELMLASVAGANGDRIDAVSALFTAGFTLLMEAIGPEHAVVAMRDILNTTAQRMVN